MSYQSDNEDSCSLCTESTTSTMESFSTVAGQLKTLSGLMEILMDQTNDFESQMKNMQRPMEGIVLNQLGDIPQLAASPFRKQLFAFKHVLPGIDASRRYSFTDICTHFRTYVFEQNLVDTEGMITVNSTLASMFEIANGTQLNYIAMMRHLRAALY